MDKSLTCYFWKTSVVIGYWGLILLEIQGFYHQVSRAMKCQQLITPLQGVASSDFAARPGSADVFTELSFLTRRGIEQYG